jgi:Excalibur calcium-binding domain
VKIRTVVASVVVAVAATLPLAGMASAQAGDRDCPDFATQAEAQQALDSRAGDPERLDRDKDGIACETEFAGDPAAAPSESGRPAATPAPAATGQVTVVPKGAVDTGDGTSTGPSMLLALAGAATVGAASVGGIAAGRRRAGQRH